MKIIDRYLSIRAMASMLLLCVFSLTSFAQGSISDGDWDYFRGNDEGTIYPANTLSHEVQLRVGAEFTKKFNCGLRLSVSEDMRFDLFNSNPSEYISNAAGSSFERSYTTLQLAYSPISYFKIDAGYTMKIYGTKGYDDVNEFMRHRVFFTATGSVKFGIVKLYLRERALCDMRTDSVNLDEKNRYGWLLKSRLGAEFTINGQPIKPYLWVELVNTLNVPDFQKYYKDNNPTNVGTQYISSVRASAGVKWRLNRRNTLNFYYRFSEDYDRDININKGAYTGKKIKIRLTEERTFLHAIGVTYEFGW